MSGNPKDPLNTGPDRVIALLKAFGSVAHGFQREEVENAAANLLVNSLRQRCATRQEAEKVFDELFGKTKTVLLDHHYDSVTGKRKSIFPHDQKVVIDKRLVDDLIKKG